jgi:uncharacterized membrane protein
MLSLALVASCVPAAPEQTNAAVEQAEQVPGEANEPSAPDTPDVQAPAGAAPARPGATPAPAGGACDTQDGEGLPWIRLRAVGTEPFWGAGVRGRCVTYSHPEDQAGTRVWTKFSGNAASGSWTGYYKGQAFSLRTRPQVDCSDGMSDRRYPIAVLLTVMGEERQGCAEPL